MRPLYILIGVILGIQAYLLAQQPMNRQLFHQNMNYWSSLLNLHCCVNLAETIYLLFIAMLITASFSLIFVGEYLIATIAQFLWMVLQINYENKELSTYRNLGLQLIILICLCQETKRFLSPKVTTQKKEIKNVTAKQQPSQVKKLPSLDKKQSTILKKQPSEPQIKRQSSKTDQKAMKTSKKGKKN